MIYEIRMPEFGAGISEGSILEWKKNPGDAVNAGDPVCEVEAEKAVQDLSSPDDGVLSLVLEDEGAVLPCGTLLAVVADPGDDVSMYRK